VGFNFLVGGKYHIGNKPIKINKKVGRRVYFEVLTKLIKKFAVDAKILQRKDKVSCQMKHLLVWYEET
jgi:flagellar biosynthesis regulator FlbT